MSNLIGESFPPEIVKQIESRQKVYGALNRSNDQIRYMNGNTAWVRLSSAVKISSQIQDASGSYISSSFSQFGGGDELAKKWVLFGGTSLYGSQEITDADGNPDSKTSFNGFYSGLKGYQLGGMSQGYRPQPGITSFETKNRDRGSIRESNIKIKCFNKEQFECIDILYLRLGYSVFIEWGHSIYVDNDGKIKDIQETDTLTSKFLNGDYDNLGPQPIYKALYDQRNKLQGNYDGFFGTVINFDWSYESDGSYNINLKLISKGDIIDTLKINPLPLGLSIETIEEKKETEENLQSAELDQDYLSYSKNKNQMAYDFWSAREKLDGNTETTTNWKSLLLLGGAIVVGTVLTIVTAGAGTPIAAILIGGAATTGVGFQVYYGKYTTDANITISKWAKTDFDCTYEEDMIKINEINGTFSFDEQLYYIRLGGFIDYVNERFLLYTGNRETKSPSNIHIDNDQGGSLIFTTENVLSSNPKICVIKTDVTTSTDTFSIFPNLPAQFREEIEGVTVGNLYNVYINMVYILKSMEEIKDKDGNSNLYDLLLKIADGINSSLGGLNKIQPVIDETFGRVYFVDETVIPNREAIFKKAYPDLNTTPAKFQVFGYEADNSSFVTQLGIKTEITNELASMITIGAQAKGTALGLDATAFSKWNEGLGDRVIPQKYDSSVTKNKNIIILLTK